MNFSSYGQGNYKNYYDSNFEPINSEKELPTFEKFQEEENLNNKNYKQMALQGDFYKTCSTDKNVDEVGRVFFSEDNFRRIQKLLKREVYNRTKGVFRLDIDQDETDLLVAMRAVYYEHNKFLPFGIVRQVKILNRKLLDYIVPDIITQIKQSYAYIQEINQPLKPLTRPINVNSAGRKTLPSLSTVWGI